jgi:hypothetical protein
MPRESLGERKVKATMTGSQMHVQSIVPLDPNVLRQLACIYVLRYDPDRSICGQRKP